MMGDHQSKEVSQSKGVNQSKHIYKSLRHCFSDRGGHQSKHIDVKDVTKLDKKFKALI